MMMFTPHNIKAPFLRPTERPVTCKPMNPVTNSIARPIIDTFFDALLQRVVRVFVSSCEKNIILIGDTATSGNDIPGQGSGNNTDMGVNGRRDLLDFFPVMMDIRGFEERFGRPDSYRLKQADAALSAVYSRLGNGNANGFQTTEADYYGPGLNAHARSAVSMPVISGGTQLSDSFVSWVRQTGGVGVFLVEGIGASSSPLVLEAVKNGAVVASCELPMRVAPVEEMFTRADGTITSFSVISGNALPPDNEKNVVFLHGFRVSQEAAREWHSEMFKRLWQSGSNVRFHGVTWFGNEGMVADGGLNYHANVVNAFETAEHLKSYVNSLPGDRIIMAHSLGNMVVSSAIADHGMNVDKYFMFNAAVPSEAFDTATYSTAEWGNPLVSHVWAGYGNQTWAATWHGLFTAPDARATLTWRNRFASIPSSILYNYYSTGDEIVGLYDLIGNDSMVTVHSYTGEDVGNFAWQKQERFKGRANFDALAGWAGTDEAGWGFHFKLGVGNDGNPALLPIYEPQQANLLTTTQLRASPVFLHAPAAMFSSNITFEAHNSLLARAIPALSGPVGSRKLEIFPPTNDRNFNMADSSYRNGWPRTISFKYRTSWLHSDIKDVAYFYVKGLFDELATNGGMK
jgi:Lysophospholipase